MQKRSSRRTTSYFRQNEEQPLKDEGTLGGGDDLEQTRNDNDSLIADMAQGFIQAQAKLTDSDNGLNNREIISLLQKVNNQLEEIKRSAQENDNSDQVGVGNNQSSSSQIAGQTTQGNSNQQEGVMLPQNLQALLKSMFKEKNSNQTNNNELAKTQSSNVDQLSNSNNNEQKTMTVQTVSQVLAEAQYELANELENSLKKLKQVISESENLANKVSNLLNEETNKKS